MIFLAPAVGMPQFTPWVRFLTAGLIKRPHNRSRLHAPRSRAPPKVRDAPEQLAAPANQVSPDAMKPWTTARAALVCALLLNVFRQ